jgi:hypothetical protein
MLAQQVAICDPVPAVVLEHIEQPRRKNQWVEYLPTSEEIAAECSRIQEAWTEEERLQRWKWAHTITEWDNFRNSTSGRNGGDVC